MGGTHEKVHTHDGGHHRIHGVHDDGGDGHRDDVHDGDHHTHGGAYYHVHSDRSGGYGT